MISKIDKLVEDFVEWFENTIMKRLDNFALWLQS